MPTIRVIDSHTGGEPTRLIVSGGAELGQGPLAERRTRFAEHFDSIRTAVVDEPRGNEIWIGGQLVDPHDPASAAGVIFFNTAGYLGMCGHGMIGTVVTLGHLGRLPGGQHTIDTPVGPVQVDFEPPNRVTLTNVPAYRYRSDVAIEVPDVGKIVGDIAWGGNWFFVIKNRELSVDSNDGIALTDMLRRVRRQLDEQGIKGEDGALIDHVELHGPPRNPENDARNFVLTPSGSYDRSPCGTGTSAKMACLAADGKLPPGRTWRQESFIGSLFECQYEAAGERIIPKISGTAFVIAESTLILDPNDPFRTGIPT